MQQFGTSVFNMVVHGQKLGEVEKWVHLIYNFRLFAIFVPKIVRFGGSLT